MTTNAIIHDNTWRSVDAKNAIYQLLNQSIDKINYYFLTTRQREMSTPEVVQLSDPHVWPIASFFSQVYCICRTLCNMEKKCMRSRVHRLFLETYVPAAKKTFFNWKDDAPTDIKESKHLPFSQIAKQILSSIFMAKGSTEAGNDNDNLQEKVGLLADTIELRNAKSFNIRDADDYLPTASDTRQQQQKERAQLSDVEQENLFLFLRFLYFLLTCNNSKIFIQLLTIYYDMIASGEEGKEGNEDYNNSIEQTCHAICRIDNIHETFSPNVDSLFEMVIYQSLSNLNTPKVNSSDPKFLEFYRVFSTCSQQLASDTKNNTVEASSQQQQKQRKQRKSYTAANGKASYNGHELF